jgi:hypothetical protein
MYSGVLLQIHVRARPQDGQVHVASVGTTAEVRSLLELYNEEFLLNSYEAVQFELPLSVLVLYTSICI